MTMVSYKMYYIPLEFHQTGEPTEGDPVYLHLSYGNYSEAREAMRVLESLYGEGRIEISVKGASEFLSLVE